MNIACIACPARYAVPDGKVAGRKVRITCKRCGTPLIVDGTTDPPGVRGDVTRSQPPGSRYLLALTEVDREDADPGQVARLYATGKITAQTLAWKKGMSTWLTLFEIEELAHALKAAGFSPPKAELPPIPRIGGTFDDSEEEEATRIVHSPLDEPEPPRPPPPPPVPEIGQTPIAELDEDEATTIFDTESLRSGAWSEPAAWADKLRDPRIPGEWREHGAISARQSPAQAGGSWEERGVEEDEVTRMVAPLEDQLQAMNAPISSRQLPPIPLPPAPTPAAGRRMSSRPPPPPRRSSQPPSLPSREEDSGPRLAGAHSEARGERVELDAIMGGGPPPGTLGGDIALLAPSAFPKAPKPEPRAPEPAVLALAPEPEPEPPAKRRTGRRLVFTLLVLVGGALGAARATGRWPLVEQTARDVWQKVNAIAR